MKRHPLARLIPAALGLTTLVAATSGADAKGRPAPARAPAAASAPASSAPAATPPAPAAPAPAAGSAAAPAPPLAAPVPPAAPAPGAPVDPSVRRLTIDDVLQLADRASYDLRAARARLDQAATQVDQALANLLPTVSAQGKYTHNYKEVTLNLSSVSAVQQAQSTLITDTFADLYAGLGRGPSAQVIADQQALVAAASAAGSSAPIVIQRQEQLDASLAATVPVIVPWGWYALKAARATLQSGEASLAAQRANILATVAQYFYAAAGNDENIAVRSDAVDLARRTLADASARVDAGTANRVDVLRAQVSLEQAVQALAEATTGRDQAYRVLATAAGIEGPFVVDAAQPPPDRFAGADPRQLALKLRPEFTQYERAIESSRLTTRSYAWRWAPTVSGFGNLRAFNYPGFAGDNYSWALGAQLDWLIYDGGLRDALRRQSRAVEAENLANRDKLLHTVVDDVDNARDQVRVRRLAVEAAARSLDLSRQTLEITRTQYQAGTATQLDLLTAQNSVINSGVTLVRARLDLALADVLLQRHAGLFPGQAPQRAP